MHVTKASAAGVSGHACVTRMRSGEKGEVWGTQKCKCKALESRMTRRVLRSLLDASDTKTQCYGF